MPQLTISASWLNEHDYCEYKFYRRYVLKEEIPRTQAMAIGHNIHAEKEEKFLEVATPATMEEFLASTRYTITKEIRLEHEFDDSAIEGILLKGKIDELAIDANNVYVIDDKPNASPYPGTLRQLWAYCILFKKNYPQVKKTVLAVLRDRDAETEVWKKPFFNENNIEVQRTLLRIKMLFKGSVEPVPNTVPGKCRACILHKLGRCEYSVG